MVVIMTSKYVCDPFICDTSNMPGRYMVTKMP